MFKKFKITTGATKEVYFVFVAFLTFIFCGINRAYLAFLFHQLDGPESEIVLHDEEKSLLAAYSSLLSPLGCFIAGIVMDLIGRKHTMQLLYLPFILSWGLIACAKNVDTLYIAFLGLSIGVGMTSVSPVTYASEICTAKYRGSLLVLLLINYNAGLLLSNYLMYLLRWNAVALIFVASAIIMLIFTHFLPESPVWFLSQGREEKSIETLCRVRGKKINDLESEIKDMKNYCASKEKNGVMKTFSNCVNAWRQLLILFLLCISAGSSGYITWQIFGIMILKRLDIPYDGGNIMIVYSIVTMIACFLTPYLLHKIPRKKILGVTSLLMSLCLLIIGLYQEFHRDISYAWIVPISLFVYSIMTSFGIVPLAFSLPGEILPSESRGFLFGLCGTFAFLYFSAVQKIFPDFLSTFGVAITMYTFATLCFLIALFAVFILPETKGKTLNQIQEEYFKKKAVNSIPDN